MKQEIRKSVSWGGRSVSWGGSIVMILVAALVLPTLFMGPAAVAEAKAQPALVEVAATEPGAAVRVIAQKTDPAADIAGLIEGLDGQFLMDLYIINAFAAEMAAEAAVQLAADPAVAWVRLDAPVERSAKQAKDESAPANTYLDTLGVPAVREMGYDGSGIGIAVIDSGISVDGDFSAFGARISFNANSATVNDVYGHGTHVAGIAAGNGWDSNGYYQGIAPGANLFSLKISDEKGMAYESDVVNAMQWVYENREAQNIRVVNMSINSTAEMSYHQSPMDAAAEILWFNGVVVVVSAGNRSDEWAWDTIDTAPANDPFLITVGAVDEAATAERGDDYMATYSANDITMDGYKKPDVAAPGSHIYSVLSKDSSWGDNYPERCSFNCQYFRLSGTSMAAPMVTGAVALLLQAEPELTPDQVKYRLMNTGSVVYGDYEAGAEFAYMDIYELLTTPTTESANTGLEASQLLWSGDDPVTWDSVSWNSVSWNSVSWNSVSWNSVSWNSVSWNSVSWNN